MVESLLCIMIPWINKAADYILGMVREAKVGEIYEAKVTRLLMDKEGKKIQGAFARYSLVLKD